LTINSDRITASERTISEVSEYLSFKKKGLTYSQASKKIKNTEKLAPRHYKCWKKLKGFVKSVTDTQKPEFPTEAVRFLYRNIPGEEKLFGRKIDLFPFKKGEIRFACQRGIIPWLKHNRFGEYEVFPERRTLYVFDKMFWLYRDMMMYLTSPLFDHMNRDKEKLLFWFIRTARKELPRFCYDRTRKGFKPRPLVRVESNVFYRLRLYRRQVKT